MIFAFIPVTICGLISISNGNKAVDEKKKESVWHGDHWEPILIQQKSTCHFNKPFDVGEHSNVISSYRADHLDGCLFHGSTISEDNSDSKFLFWSPFEIPFIKDICGNCFIFRNCDEKYRTSIRRKGNTYQLFQTIAKENTVKPPGKAGNSSLGYTNTKCKKGYHCRYPIQSTKKLAERSVNTSSRIINAKPQKHHIYPWMAQVQVTVAFDLNYPPSDTGSPAAITGSGGSIISNHVILTAGHSLCVDEYHTYFDGKSRFQITCPLSAGEADDNLNRVDVNEINFLVGDNHHRIIDPTYNPNVEAFLYEYEKERYAFSANGDVGILVIKGGLGIDGHSIQGSCLPEPDQFQEELTVKHVGWGLRFDQLIVNGQVTKTSCHTNEGTTSGDIHNSLSSERRVQFLDCKISNSGEKFCNDWLLRKGVETLSAITDVSEITGNSDDELHFNLKKREEQKICEDYLKKAKKAWHDDGRSETEFYERIDRIIIRKFGENQIRPENICYNLQKVAAYGFCVTEKSTPRNWGFCSRSCEYFPVDANTVLGINKPYEEGYYRYFETNPYPRDVFKDHYPAELQSVFKCATAVIPRATNAIFQESDIGGNLVWQAEIDDAERPEGEHGHMQSGTGDSGGPFWIEDRGQVFLMAVYRGIIPNRMYPVTKNIYPSGYYHNRPEYNWLPQYDCGAVATKLTEDIVDWLSYKIRQADRM